MTNTLTDLDLIRCRLKTIKTDIDMIETILKRLEERHRGNHDR